MNPVLCQVKPLFPSPGPHSLAQHLFCCSRLQIWTPQLLSQPLSSLEHHKKMEEPTICLCFWWTCTLRLHVQVRNNLDSVDERVLGKQVCQWISESNIPGGGGQAHHRDANSAWNWLYTGGEIACCGKKCFASLLVFSQNPWKQNRIKKENLVKGIKFLQLGFSSFIMNKNEISKK